MKHELCGIPVWWIRHNSEVSNKWRLFHFKEIHNTSIATINQVIRLDFMAKTYQSLRKMATATSGFKDLHGQVFMFDKCIDGSRVCGIEVMLNTLLIGMLR